jgi:hypothetical protein
MDVLYIIQKYGGVIITYLKLLESSSKQHRAEIVITDDLSKHNPYGRRELQSTGGLSSPGSIIDFLDLRTWHVLEYVGHYFMSIMFIGIYIYIH